ncbi:hypothetical protein EDB86DRAFT_2987590 [Lactarius hatsudake]|nr:hypothetical protein EDB86DRAFT_2987590 [Lactarius hatsudake]
MMLRLLSPLHQHLYLQRNLQTVLNLLVPLPSRMTSLTLRFPVDRHITLQPLLLYVIPPPLLPPPLLLFRSLTRRASQGSSPVLPPKPYRVPPHGQVTAITLSLFPVYPQTLPPWPRHLPPLLHPIVQHPSLLMPARLSLEKKLQSRILLDRRLILMH